MLFSYTNERYVTAGGCDSSVEIFLFDTTPFVDDFWRGKTRNKHDWSGISKSRDDQLRMQTEVQEVPCLMKPVNCLRLKS